MKKYLLLLFILFALSGFSKPSDTTVFFYFGKTKILVNIKYPKTKIRGTVFLLHGYNLPASQWCEKTDLCKKASEFGFVMIIPDFLKTTYQEKFYKETNPNFRIYPTRKWIRDTVILQLQSQFHLLINGENNFVYGLSTGARGAALLAVDLPETFKGCACLSGDFDQSKLPLEKIYHNYYGPYETFKKRWATDDNLHYLIQRWKMPIYIAHGLSDNICPSSQSSKFWSLIHHTYPNLLAKLNIVSNAKHNYDFWGSQTQPVLSFFNDLIKD